MAKNDYDVFICYKRLSADDFALRLREALKEYDIRAFVDSADIPKEYELTELWWQYRDNALKNSGTFIMLVTIGFEKSEEIIKEIKLARESRCKCMVFRWHTLSPDLTVDLGNTKLNLSDFEQVAFDSAGMLVRQFFDSYKKQYETPPSASKDAVLSFLTVPPILHYEITQRVRDTNRQRALPNVGFNIRSWHPSPLKVRVSARVILGSEDLGMVEGQIRNGKHLGYYNGETEWNLNPYNIVFGNLNIRSKCATGGETLTIEVTIVGTDERGVYFQYLPVAYTFDRDNNTWFYEPTAF